MKHTGFDPGLSRLVEGDFLTSSAYFPTQRGLEGSGAPSLHLQGGAKICFMDAVTGEEVRMTVREYAALGYHRYDGPFDVWSGPWVEQTYG